MNPPKESMRPTGKQSATEKTDTVTTIGHAVTVNEIASLYSEIIGAARASLEKAINIGELLAGIRGGLKHGEWLPWIQKNLPFSEKTAQNYIRYFNEKDRLKSANVADLSGAYLLLTEPKATPDEPATEDAWLDTPLTLEDFQPLPVDAPHDDYDVILSVGIMRAFCLGPVFKDCQPIPVTRREFLEVQSQLEVRRAAEARKKD